MSLDFLGSLSPPLAGRDGGPDDVGSSQFDSDTLKEDRLASKEQEPKPGPTAQQH